MKFAISQPKVVRLPRDEKQTYRFELWASNLTMGLTLAMTLIFEFSRSYMILTIWWPRSSLRIYQIVTGVTSVVGVPSTHLVVFWYYHICSSSVINIRRSTPRSGEGFLLRHYSEVIMGAMASQITSLAIVYSTMYLGVAQRKYQSSASLAFVWGIHWWPVNSPTQMGSNVEKC